MKSKVILFCVLLFCSKIVDSIPHSENHVRQRVDPLSNWQVNKNVPNAQYVNTDFTQTRSVNKLAKTATQQENNEDYYSNQRGYNYDSSNGYNEGSETSSSAKKLLVNHDSLADRRRLDSYPPRVKSYPSHTSQVGFDHQQYKNQEWRSQNPFTNSVPSSVLIPNNERQLVTSVEEPYRGVAQYLQQNHVTSSNRRFYHPERSSHASEQFQYPSVDHSVDNKYVVNPTTRLRSRGPVPYENYSEGQATETHKRPTRVHRYAQNFGSSPEINYETSRGAIESADTLIDQSENTRYPVPYENYREGQVSETKTSLTGVPIHVQNYKINYETPVVETLDTLVDQSENTRYPVPYENYREGQVSETKPTLTGIHKLVQNSEINYETPAIESLAPLVGQNENTRYPVPYENYREAQVLETKPKLTGVRKLVQNSEINYETPAVESLATLVGQNENTRYPVPYENYREGQVPETKPKLTGVRKHVQNSEINYETPAVESLAPMVGQYENTRFPVPHDNYREGQVPETKPTLTEVRKLVQNSEINYETPVVESLAKLVGQNENTRYPVPYENYREPKRRLTGVRKFEQIYETPTEIIYETPDVESADTLVDQLENIRYPVPYENYREGQVSETKRRLTGVRKFEQIYETPTEIIYETPDVESADTLVDQLENIRYPVPYENYREGQVSETKRRLTGVHKFEQIYETPTEIIYETPDVESADTLVDQSENTRYPIPYENYREGQVSETKRRLTGVHKFEQIYETPTEIIYETPDVESADTLVDQSENTRYPIPYENYREGQVSETKRRLSRVRKFEQIYETPTEKMYETPDVESADTLVDQSENIKHVQTSRTHSHLGNSAPIPSHDNGPVISETDNYSSDSSPINLAPVVNVKKEATVENRKRLDDNPLARKYAHRSDYEWNDAPTDITETVEVKAGKYGVNYAEKNAVPLNIYPEDSLTPTKTTLENSGTLIHEESHVPQFESSSPNDSKPNTIHHLTSEIKELSLKSLVANPEIQHILSRTDKRYVVVHSNGTIEYMDTLPPDSQQDSKLRLVHTKRRNIDGSEGDGVLTPQFPQKLPNNIAKAPVPLDEYPWPINSQPADEYDSHHVIPLENLPAGQSHLKPLVLHAEQSVHKESSKPLPRPVYESADGGYSKPWIPNEDQPVDDSNLNQYQDDDNSKTITSNEAQSVYNANPKPAPKKQSEDNYNFYPLPHDVNHPTNDDIWTAPENQLTEVDQSKPSLTDVNKGKDEINLTPYAINPIHVKRHAHVHVTHPENDKDFKPVPPHITHPVHRHNSKHLYVNHHEDDDNSNSASKNQPAENNISKFLHSNTGDTFPDTQPENDKIAKLQTINEYQSEDNTEAKQSLSHIKQRAPLNKSGSKYTLINKPADINNSSPVTPDENLNTNYNVSKPLPLNENDKRKEDDTTNKTQTVNENDNIGTKPSSPPKKPRARLNKSKPKNHLPVNEESDDDNSNSSSEDENTPRDNSATKPLVEKENQPEVDNEYTRLPPHKKQRAPLDKSGSKYSLTNKPADNNNSNPVTLDENHQTNYDISKTLPLSEDDNQKEDDTTNKPQPINENDDIGTKLLSPPKTPRARHNTSKPNTHLLVNEESGEDISSSSSEDENKPEDINAAEPLHVNENQLEVDIEYTRLPPHKKQRAPLNKSGSKHTLTNKPVDNNNSNPVTPDENHQTNVKISKPLPLNEDDKQKVNERDNISTKPLSPPKKPRARHNKSKPNAHLSVNEESDEDNSSSSSEDDNKPEDNNAAEPLHANENQPEVDTEYTKLLPHKKQRAPLNKPGSKHTLTNKPAYNNNSNPVTPDENHQLNVNIPKPFPLNGDDRQKEYDTTNKPQTVNENDDISTKTLLPPKKSRTRHNKSEPESHLLANEESDEDNSNSSSQDENKPEDHNVAKPLHGNENYPEVDTEYTRFPPHKKQRTPINKSGSKQTHTNKPVNNNNSNPVTPDENHQTNVNNSKPLSDKQKDDETTNKPQTINENEDIGTKPLSPPKKSRTRHNKSKPKTHLFVNEESNENNPNSSSQDENSPRDNSVAEPLHAIEKQPEVDTEYTKLPPHKKQRAPINKSGSKHTLTNKPADNNNPNPVNPDENHQTNVNISKPLPLNEDDKQKEVDTINKPQTVNENDDIDTKLLSLRKKPRTRHNKPKPKKHLLAKEESDDDDNSNSPSQDVNQPRDNNAAETLLYVSSENVDESKSKTLSPSVPSYSTTPKSQGLKKHKRKRRNRKTTTISPVVSTTPSQNDSTEDQIITLSPSEQVTDNVSDVPTLTTTTAKLVETPDKKKTYKDSNNKPDEVQDDTKSSSEDQTSNSDKVLTSTATTSSSTSPADNASVDKSNGRYEENEDKAVVSKENNEKHNTQTAVYNSNELLDTTTGVLEESDEYSPVIPPLSVQTDVNTSDSSSELEQSETDATITVSSSKTYDSKGDIITINIEVSESTDLPSNDKTLVVNIDTHPDNDDDSKALETDAIKITKTDDCKEDHDHDEDRGKNSEFDLSNLKGESTIWIKTTNQDFINQLTAKNDTQFDVIYFFSIENRPATVEREKETTIFCNGTVVIETTEITYEHEDDPEPTIAKTTEIMDIEDYELYK